MANILGLKVTSHDTGAALIFGDRVIAISEERLNRVKHSLNMFPEKAIDYCLAAFKLSPADIDLVVLDQVGSPAASPSERLCTLSIIMTRMPLQFFSLRLFKKPRCLLLTGREKKFTAILA